MPGSFDVGRSPSPIDERWFSFGMVNKRDDREYRDLHDRPIECTQKEMMKGQEGRSFSDRPANLVFGGTERKLQRCKGATLASFIADRAMRSDLVVSTPSRAFFDRLVETHEPARVQALGPELAV